MSDKLLPCPFCGGEARVMLEEEDMPDNSFHNVYCMNCGAQFWVNSKSEAITAWNRRTQPNEPVKHGKRVMDTYPDDGDCRCSNCKVCIDALHRRNHNLLEVLGYKLNTFYSYCPNCEAKMDKESDNNA